MSRLIDADRLYEVIKNSWDTSDAEDFEKSVFVALATAPTIEQRKTGKWIERNPQNSDKCRLIECDQCGFARIVGFNVPYEDWVKNRNYCERCGADMRGEQE